MTSICNNDKLAKLIRGASKIKIKRQHLGKFPKGAGVRNLGGKFLSFIWDFSSRVGGKIPSNCLELIF